MPNKWFQVDSTCFRNCKCEMYYRIVRIKTALIFIQWFDFVGDKERINKYGPLFLLQRKSVSCCDTEKHFSTDSKKYA